MSISIIAEFKLKVGRGDDFAEYIKWHQNESRKEVGCQYFQANRDPERSDVFLMYEIYDDHDAIQRHRDTPHYQKFATEIVPDMIEMQGDSPFVSRQLMMPID